MKPEVTILKLANYNLKLHVCLVLDGSMFDYIIVRADISDAVFGI